jgi:hypothetical protein
MLTTSRHFPLGFATKKPGKTHSTFSCGGTGTMMPDFRNQSSVLSASFLKRKGTFLDVLIPVG